MGIFRNLSQPSIERKKKEIIKIFKSFGLSIAVTTDVTSANYFDVDFELTTDFITTIYNPYRKQINEPVYINKYSKYSVHFPNIVRQVLLSVRPRISNISSNQSIFNTSIPVYKKPSKRMVQR